MLSPAPPRIVFIVLIPVEKSAWSIPVSCYLMRRIAQFLQVLGPRSNNSLSLSSSNWSIIFSTILLTKELIFIYNYSYSSNYARGNRCHDSEWFPKLDNLDYLFWNSSIRCSWTLLTHVIQSPTLFVRVLLLTGLGDDGLDLCFSLLLACPY